MILTICLRRGPAKWYTGYDCVLKQEVLFRIIPHVLPADNPQQAEHCSHMTGKGSRPCRRCEVGGSAAECEEDETYEQFFSVSPHCRMRSMTAMLMETCREEQSVRSRVRSARFANNFWQRVSEFRMELTNCKQKQVSRTRSRNTGSRSSYPRRASSRAHESLILRVGMFAYAILL